MKWSEQMRELLSEDEHYNQLMLNTEMGMLFINGEFICVLGKEGTARTLPLGEFEKMVRKYPFFNDIKFLLNCIFISKNPNFISYKKYNNVRKYKTYYEICDDTDTALLRIYFKKSQGSDIN